MDKLNLRTETIGNLIIETYHLVDDAGYVIDPSRYEGLPPEDIATYTAQDEARFETWVADEWNYLGICVDVRIKTAANWAEHTIVGRASIWGVESDSGADYIRELERDMRVEAINDMWKTFDALRVTYAAVAANGALLGLRMAREAIRRTRMDM